MQKDALTQQFAHRLRDAMLAAGLNSQRSTSGVSIHSLVEITGYSEQICRKYLRGEAIPEPSKIITIAQRLNVAPGWLLFGDEHNDRRTGIDELLISKDLLRYIFSRATVLYNAPELALETPGFLMDLIEDISQIDASAEQSKRIIDLTLSSITHFNNPQRK